MTISNPTTSTYLTFVQTDLGDYSTSWTTNGAWTAADISSSIPTTAKFVLIGGGIATGGQIGCRATGSSTNAMMTSNTGFTSAMWIVPVTSARTLEYYRSTGAYFRLLGYFVMTT